MKIKLLFSAIALLAICQTNAQQDNFWSAHKGESSKITVTQSTARLSFPEKFDLYTLSIEPLRAALFSASDRKIADKGIVISLPNTKGALEQFEMFEASNFEAGLQMQFPDIRAYVGKGLTDKNAQLRLSISPQGVQTMVLRAGERTEFMEPYSQDGKIYAVYNSSRNKGKLPFTCSTEDAIIADNILQNVTASKSSTGQLMTFKLALS